MPESDRPTLRPFDRLPGFALVGVVGFAIDSGVLSLLVHVLELNIYVCRGVSFASAVTVTWLLNRTLIFHVGGGAPRRSGEYGRYLGVQIVGALVNLGVFWAMLNEFPQLKSTPIVALAAGAVFGLLVNYAGSKYWVFSEHSGGPGT